MCMLLNAKLANNLAFFYFILYTTTTLYCFILYGKMSAQLLLELKDFCCVEVVFSKMAL